MKSNHLPVQKIQKTSTSGSSQSIIIIKSPHYKGLPGSEVSNIPELFPRHPVYNFPVISSKQHNKVSNFIRVHNQSLALPFEAYQKKSPFQPKSGLYSVVPKNSANLHSFYSNLYSLSSTLHKGTRGESTNLESLSSLRSSISKQELTASQRDLILQMQRNFTCRNSNKKYLQSISSNSSCSEDYEYEEEGSFNDMSEVPGLNAACELSQVSKISKVSKVTNSSAGKVSRASKASRASKLSKASKPENFLGSFDSIQAGHPKLKFEPQESSISLLASGEAVFTSVGLELSMLEWDKKRKTLREQAKLNTTKNAYLISESDDQGSELLFQSKIALDTARALQQSIDSPPEDEGPIRVSCATRLFLDGHTASKHRLMEEWPASTQVLPKVLADSQVLDLETTRNFHCACSPLLRKVVICEEARPVLQELSCRNEEQAGYGGNGNLVVQVLSSVPVTGYLSCPTLKYHQNPSAQGYCTLENLCIADMLSIPVLKSLQDLPIKLISCGYEHVVGLTSMGKIYSWGIGSAGCLGHNNHENYELPEAINKVFSETFTTIECGGYHTLATTEEGQVWAWGRNDVGQCALNSKSLVTDDIGTVALRPFRVKALANEHILQVACGEAHSLFLTDKHKVLSAGWNDEGQLGVHEKKTVNFVPIKEKIVRIRAGSIFSLAVTDCGKVCVWGNGDHGELGLGNSIKKVARPTYVSGIGDEALVDIVCGESHCVALGVSKAFAWGKGIVDGFEDFEKYPEGSDIICYAPVQVTDVDAVQLVVVGKTSHGELSRMVSEKLQRIKTQDM